MLCIWQEEQCFSVGYQDPFSYYKNFVFVATHKTISKEFGEHTHELTFTSYPNENITDTKIQNVNRFFIISARFATKLLNFNP